MLIGTALSSLFALMPALGHHPATIFIGRFFSGLFGVSPVAILGGIISDCWDPRYRGVAMAACISFVFSGPTYGPIIGGFIANSSLGWRWTMWLIIIIGLFSTILGVFIFPETYPPVLLERKIQRLQRQGATDANPSTSDKPFQITKILRQCLVRPLCT